MDEDRFTDEQRAAERAHERAGVAQPSFTDLKKAMEKHGPDGVLESATHLPVDQYEKLEEQSRRMKFDKETRKWIVGTPQKTKRPTYSPEVKAWAKRAAELLGAGFVPGPKQHIRVREVVGDQDVEKVTGMSQYNLQHYVDTGSIAKPDRASLKKLADKVDDVGARNRNLAAILVVMIEEREAA